MESDDDDDAFTIKSLKRSRLSSASRSSAISSKAESERKPKVNKVLKVKVKVHADSPHPVHSADRPTLLNNHASSQRSAPLKTTNVVVKRKDKGHKSTPESETKVNKEGAKSKCTTHNVQLRSPHDSLAVAGRNSKGLQEHCGDSNFKNVSVIDLTEDTDHSLGFQQKMCCMESETIDTALKQTTLSKGGNLIDQPATKIIPRDSGDTNSAQKSRTARKRLSVHKRSNLPTGRQNLEKAGDSRSAVPSKVSGTDYNNKNVSSMAVTSVPTGLSSKSADPPSSCTATDVGGRCPFCQMPFTALTGESPDRHTMECMDIPLKTLDGMCTISLVTALVSFLVDNSLLETSGSRLQYKSHAKLKYYECLYAIIGLI
jgi:hypothetical protein